MPNLLAVLDESAFGALEEPFQGLYKQNAETKKYFLNLPESEAEKLTFNLKDQISKKEALTKKAFDEKNEAQKQLDAFAALGKSPDEIKAELESSQPEAINELIAKHKTEIESIKHSMTEEVEKYRGKYESADTLLAKAKYGEVAAQITAKNDLDTELAPKVLRDHIKIESDDDGNKTVKVYDNGIPFTHAGEPGTVQQLIDSFKESGRYSGMFNAGKAGGMDTDARQEGVVLNGTVSASDQQALNQNVEGLASGKIRAV